MGSRSRDAVAPLYLLLCLTLGGSAQGIWANMILQLLGILILAWAAVSRTGEWFQSDQRQLFGLIMLGLAVVMLQLVPLPPAIWTQLGGREPIESGFAVLKIAPPWLPISLTPYKSAANLLSLIPPLALLAALWRLGARPLWLILALIAGTFAGILLGALQVGSADPQTSPWYLYRRTNFGVATGFFANGNHMATLLVISLPFLAAVLASVRGRRNNVQRTSAVVALVAGGALVIAVGLALNRSLAGYGLAAPVLAASALILLGRRSSAVRWIAVACGMLALAAAGGLLFSPLGGPGLRASAATSVQTRHEIMATTAQAAGDFMPLGSGVGSFRRVYALYEDHERLDPAAVVNHAHNDYLELALETGLPGMLILILFLAWWLRAAARAWRNSELGPFARAATIASAAILVHSLVDFPLRTAAISACFAMCLGLMAARRSTQKGDQSSLWQTRHVVIG